MPSVRLLGSLALVSFQSHHKKWIRWFYFLPQAGERAPFPTTRLRRSSKQPTSKSFRGTNASKGWRNSGMPSVTRIFVPSQLLRQKLASETWKNIWMVVCNARQQPNKWYSFDLSLAAGAMVYARMFPKKDVTFCFLNKTFRYELMKLICKMG